MSAVVKTLSDIPGNHGNINILFSSRKPVRIGLEPCHCIGESQADKEFTFKRLFKVDSSIQLGKNTEASCLKHQCFDITAIWQYCPLAITVSGQ